MAMKSINRTRLSAKLWGRVAAGMLLAGLLPAAVALAQVPELILRDAVTGLGVTGRVTLASIEGELAPFRELIDAHLSGGQPIQKLAVEVRVALAIEQPHALRAEAMGYRPLHTVLRPSADHRGWTLLLEPLEAPGAMAARADDRLVIDGWVHDHQTFEPLAGVAVSVGPGSALALSDPGGYFSLAVDSTETDRRRPELITIQAGKSGYPDWTRTDLLPAQGRTTLRISLGAPSPKAPSHRQLGREPVWPVADPSGHRAPAAAGGRADQPPVSISVGFGDAGCSQPCCTGNCPYSCTMPLETYVRRGIGDEWIASWSHDALAAGAVAYRSYGAWHVLNPPAHGAYDICSSPCCQMNDPDTHTATEAAVAATAGVMLIRQGGVFRSEYSAQNNCLQGEMSCSNADLSCGDGYAGSPVTGWPCLADPVGAGQDCFGHGRGMSQWGNHFWTQASPARNWKWQLNHYYNDHGNGSDLRTAVISQVLSIEGLSVSPATIQPGQSFTIEIDGRNLAADTHEQVMIGASLRRGTDPFIDDPDNDEPVALSPGLSSVSRPFDLPAQAPAGSYALWVALWIDVDRNGQISGEDLSQHLVIAENAVTVGGDDVFRDRFEWAAARFGAGW